MYSHNLWNFSVRKLFNNTTFLYIFFVSDSNHLQSNYELEVCISQHFNSYLATVWFNMPRFYAIFSFSNHTKVLWNNFNGFLCTPPYKHFAFFSVHQEKLCIDFWLVEMMMISRNFIKKVWQRENLFSSYIPHTVEITKFTVTHLWRKFRESN